MRFFINFFPVPVFILFYFLKDVYWATAALIVSQIMQIVVLRALNRELEVTTKVAFFLTLLFGGLTLIFHQPRFIEMKPTVVYWLLSLMFLISHLKGKNIPEMFLKKNLEFDVLPSTWANLNLSWVLVFFLLGLVNIFVASFFSVRVWFYFKLYGVSVFFLLFSIFQVFYLWKRRVGPTDGQSR